jgi:hypothetical protein
MIICVFHHQVHTIQTRMIYRQMVSNDNLCFLSSGTYNANTNDLQADGESHLVGVLWTIQMLFQDYYMLDRFIL